MFVYKFGQVRFIFYSLWLWWLWWWYFFRWFGGSSVCIERKEEQSGVMGPC